MEDMNSLGVAADTMVLSTGALIRAVLIISLVSADYRRISIGMTSSTWSQDVISVVVLGS